MLDICAKFFINTRIPTLDIGPKNFYKHLDHPCFKKKSKKKEKTA